MNSPSLWVLTALIAWALALLLLMEVLRTRLVLLGRVPSNAFVPDNANLSPFMQRLARAHANCIEGLPLFGGIMLLAVVASVMLAHAAWHLAARKYRSGFVGRLSPLYGNKLQVRTGAAQTNMAIKKRLPAKALFY